MRNIESILFPFIGGLGLFIFGMHTLAAGLQKTAGSRMKQLLEKMTNNRVLGVFVGFLVTGIIQSSSATTVMVVGFVNAGLMQVGQTVGLIMGANIGTTVTAWIVSSVEWARFLKPTTLAPLFTGIGACMTMFSKHEKYRRVGEIVVGFGILFLGMDLMSSAVKPLSGSALFTRMFTQMGHNPLLGILAGAAVTGVIQSSSASVGILQSLAAAGLVPWSAAVYIIMGQNIGTCVTALLSSIGTSKSAKSAAYIHLMFNVIGSAVFSIAAVLYFKFANPALGMRPIEMTEISLVHTAFNAGGTILLFGFANKLVFLAKKMAGVTDGASAAAVHLDDRMLGNPSIAAESCSKEIARMGEIAQENLTLSCEAILDKDIDKVQKVMAQEETIDLLQQGITRFLAKICASPSASKAEKDWATSLFHTVSDIERVGDHSENLAEVAEVIIAEGTVFSEQATKQLEEMIKLTCDCFRHSMEALAVNDTALAEKVVEEEEYSDRLQQELRSDHLLRLSNDECSALSSVSFMDVITNLERVADHAKNIAQLVLGKR